MRFSTIPLFLLAFALLVNSALQKSPTVDEQGHLFRGVAYLKTGATHFLWGHPLLASTLNALPLLTITDLRLPIDDPAWAEGRWAVAGELFLWQLNNHPQRLIFLGRLTTIWLTLLLAALVFHWGCQLKGVTAGLLAFILLLFDPNVLAHGQLITSDLPLTFFLTVTMYGYWRWVGRRGWLSDSNLPYPSRLIPLLLAGIALGAAAATKFNAALLLPTLAILGIGLAVRRRSAQPLLALLLMGIIAWLTVWGVYRFAWYPLPGGAFWDDLTWQFTYLSRPHGAYLLGQSDPWGWWYYFPIAFLVKTPLPILLLLLWACGRWARLKGWRKGDDYFLLLPPIIYFLISLSSPLNIGYRHLIPMLPFLVLFIAVVLWPGSQPGLVNQSHWRPPRPRATYLLPVAASLMIATAIFTWPDYIPYFNGLISWSPHRWRILSDSNIDWGQDLPALARWQQQTGEPLLLSYFGVAHPSAYGIQFTPLPTWEPGPEQINPAYQSFNPVDPAPGVYAISVTNLHGLVLGNEANTFAWFRDRKPVARIGGSIYIYQVDPIGPPVEVAFAGVQPADLAPGLHQQFGSNDIQVRWFAAETSLVWPDGDSWLVTAGPTPDPALQPFWPTTPIRQAGGQRLFRPAPQPDFPWISRPVVMGDTITFLGYRPIAAASGEVALISAWQIVQATTRPLKIFVHALDAHGEIAGQWDGLDVLPASWQPGDRFIQLHRFLIPLTATSEQVDIPLSLVIGVYDGHTLERLGEWQHE